MTEKNLKVNEEKENEILELAPAINAEAGQKIISFLKKKIGYGKSMFNPDCQFRQAYILGMNDIITCLVEVSNNAEEIIKRRDNKKITKEL